MSTGVTKTETILIDTQAYGTTEYYIHEMKNSTRGAYVHAKMCFHKSYYITG